MAGRGRDNGGGSGRPPRPPDIQPELGPVGYLRSVVKDAGRPHRDRGAAARALLNKQARDKRERRLTSKDDEWQEVMEAGWWAEGWHVGYNDPTVGPSDPMYGRCLLHWDQPARDPRGPKFRVRHPSESEYRQQTARAWEAARKLPR
jgi:hypothetical protein